MISALLMKTAADPPDYRYDFLHVGGEVVVEVFDNPMQEHTHHLSLTRTYSS